GRAAPESRRPRARVVVRGGALRGLAQVLGRHGNHERRGTRLLAGLLDLDVGHCELKSSCVGGWGRGEVGPASPPPHIPTSVKGLLPEGYSCRNGEEARGSAAFPDAHEAPFHEKV